MKIEERLIRRADCANVIMWSSAYSLYRPILRSETEKTPCAGDGATAPSHRCRRNNPPETVESGDIPAPEETGGSLSTEERPDFGGLSLVTLRTWLIRVRADANIIGQYWPADPGELEALILYDPDNESTPGALRVSQHRPCGYGGELSLTLDWYQIFGPTKEELR